MAKKVFSVANKGLFAEEGDVYLFDFEKEGEEKIVASRQLNIDCGSISKCCRNKQKQCGGFTFKYITNENI